MPKTLVFGQGRTMPHIPDNKAFGWITGEQINRQFAMGIRMIRMDNGPIPMFNIVCFCKMCGWLLIFQDVYELNRYISTHYGTCNGEGMATPDFPKALEDALVKRSEPS